VTAALRRRIGLALAVVLSVAFAVLAHGALVQSFSPALGAAVSLVPIALLLWWALGQSRLRFVALVALAIGVPAGYGIARTQAHKLTVLILIARMTPALSYLIPLFTVFQLLGLNNTRTALVITHLVITVPIIVYVMAGHFETLPRELEEAALIDGGSVWTTFRYVALPLARPGIVVATILAFIFSWNNFVFGAVLAGRATRTLPAAVYNVLTFEQLAWGPLAAAAIVVTLPVLLLTIVIQKEIVVGLTHGGIKG